MARSPRSRKCLFCATSRVNELEQQLEERDSVIRGLRRERGVLLAAVGQSAHGPSIPTDGSLGLRTLGQLPTAPLHPSQEGFPIGVAKPGLPLDIHPISPPVRASKGHSKLDCASSRCLSSSPSTSSD